VWYSIILIKRTIRSIDFSHRWICLYL
jgi:hypothetical protein